MSHRKQLWFLSVSSYLAFLGLVSLATGRSSMVSESVRSVRVARSSVARAASIPLEMERPGVPVIQSASVDSTDPDGPSREGVVTSNRVAEKEERADREKENEDPQARVLALLDRAAGRASDPRHRRFVEGIRTLLQNRQPTVDPASAFRQLLLEQKAASSRFPSREE